ncbi:MFS transporter [Williamsia sterculiae]|uniref:Multidrug efflux pump Tap n=1 Tax=Williamsia sterculiae TaxID=1344003 RepID=A0A1N7H918_9NOCA|nr:MFS transporter [Williamsia sterculiae]SIS21281.1 Predicted arabinose efflux permease, MFS family [Williamsia sterculiae]
MSSLFGVRDYRHLFAAQVVALFGTGLATVALGLLAYELAAGRAAAVLGTALALKMVTYVVVAPVVAAHADRVPRRLLLVGLDLVRLGVVVLLPFVTEVWQVYALVVVLQSASAAFTPTFQAVLPDLLPDEGQYTRALSYSQLASTMETLLSPLLAALVVSVVSFHWLFVGTAVGFAMSAVMVVTSRIPDATPSRRDGAVERTVAGLRIFLATPRLRGLLGTDLAVAAVGSIVLVDTVTYVRQTLGGSSSDVALLLACNGIGVIIAAVLVPRVVDRAGDRGVMLTGCAVLTTAAIAAVGLSTATAGTWRWPAVAVIWMIVGAGTGLVLTPTGRVLRRSSADTDRAAVFAAQFSLSHACWLVGYPIAGWVATGAGYPLTWSILLCLTVVGTVVAARCWPRSDPSALPHVHTSDAGPGHLVGAESTSAGHWRHTHDFVIDAEHRHWPRSAA